MAPPSSSIPRLVHHLVRLGYLLKEYVQRYIDYQNKRRPGAVTAILVAISFLLSVVYVIPGFRHTRIYEPNDWILENRAISGNDRLPSTDPELQDPVLNNDELVETSFNIKGIAFVILVNHETAPFLPRLVASLYTLSSTFLIKPDISISTTNLEELIKHVDSQVVNNDPSHNDDKGTANQDSSLTSKYDNIQFAARDPMSIEGISAVVSVISMIDRLLYRKPARSSSSSSAVVSWSHIVLLRADDYPLIPPDLLQKILAVSKCERNHLTNQTIFPPWVPHDKHLLYEQPSRSSLMHARMEHLSIFQKDAVEQWNNFRSRHDHLFFDVASAVFPVWRGSRTPQFKVKDTEYGLIRRESLGRWPEKMGKFEMDPLPRCERISILNFKLARCAVWSPPARKLWVSLSTSGMPSEHFFCILAQYETEFCDSHWLYDAESRDPELDDPSQTQKSAPPFLSSLFADHEEGLCLSNRSLVQDGTYTKSSSLSSVTSLLHTKAAGSFFAASVESKNVSLGNQLRDELDRFRALYADGSEFQRERLETLLGVLLAFTPASRHGGASNFNASEHIDSCYFAWAQNLRAELNL